MTKKQKLHGAPLTPNIVYGAAIGSKFENMRFLPTTARTRFSYGGIPAILDERFHHRMASQYWMLLVVGIIIISIAALTSKL